MIHYYNPPFHDILEHTLPAAAISDDSNEDQLPYSPLDYILPDMEDAQSNEPSPAPNDIEPSEATPTDTKPDDSPLTDAELDEPTLTDAEPSVPAPDPASHTAPQPKKQQKPSK